MKTCFLRAKKTGLKVLPQEQGTTPHLSPPQHHAGLIVQFTIKIP
jgi:hypothetical protein